MKVIFLDRDGVINRFPGRKKYVTSLKKFKFIPEALTALKKLTRHNYRVFVISNQAGVSKKVYSFKTLLKITNYMLDEFKKRNIRIDEIDYCTHLHTDNCTCRKPNTGLVEKHLKRLKVKKSQRSKIYFVGDSITDVQTGKRAHLKTILVLSGRESKANKKNWQVMPDYVTKDLNTAVNYILRRA